MATTKKQKKVANFSLEEATGYLNINARGKFYLEKNINSLETKPKSMKDWGKYFKKLGLI